MNTPLQDGAQDLGASELISRADALLDPATGAMRGLFDDDPESKLLRIRVAELRRFDDFVRQARALASGVVAAQSHPEPQP